MATWLPPLISVILTPPLSLTTSPGSGFPQAIGLDRQDARTPKFSGSKSKAEAAIRLWGSLSAAADLKIA